MIANRFDVFLFDLDGVIYIGDEAVSGAVTTVNSLQQEGKQIRFLTNDPRWERGAIVERLTDLGIEVVENEIVTSSWAAGEYLRQQGVSTAAVIGSEGLRDEVRNAGINITDKSPDSVVVGADEQTAYGDIRRAARHIHQGAKFIGTNPDGSFPTPDGPAPGAGAIVRAVEAAVDTEPTIVGKPEPLMFEMALEDIDAGQQAVVIGDNPETDILGAHRAGITGILFDDEEPTPDSARDFKQPDATLKELSDLFSDTVTPWDEPQYSWPDEIRPGVSAVVLNDAGEVLLLKRADREQWALPTGTVERGEAVNEAIKREMLEETGLRISVDRLTGVYSHPDQQVFSYPSGRVVHFVTSCFTCTIEQGTPKADEDEALDVEFFDVDNLPEDILSMQPQWISDAIEKDSTSIR